MDRSTRGFTLHEFIITLALGAVVLSIAVQNTAGARQAYSVNAAETMFRALGAWAHAADPDCDSFTGSASVRFVAGGRERSTVIQPLGQVTTP